MVTTAGQPDHDGQQLCRLHPRTPHVDGEAILLALDVLPDDLGADRPEAAAVPHTGPVIGCFGWLPAQSSDRRPRIRDAFERQHVTPRNTTDGPLLSTR